MADTDLSKRETAMRDALITLAYCFENDCGEGRISYVAYAKRIDVIEKALDEPVSGIVRP